MGLKNATEAALQWIDSFFMMRVVRTLTFPFLVVAHVSLGLDKTVHYVV